MSEEVLDNKSIQNEKGKHEARFVYNGVSSDDLTQKVDSLMKSEGYKLEAGQPGNAVYGKGNKVMRILFGAFVKRYAFRVQVENQGSDASLHFLKDGKGYMGGAVGVSQVKKEFARMVGQIEQKL